MAKPSLREEKRLWRKGYKFVACLDEAGVGPLAGPVVAAAVIINKISNIKYQKYKSNIKKLNNTAIKQFNSLNIRDSKKLSPRKREEFYKILKKHPAIGWGVGIVSEKIIDKINIKNAAELAMEKALKKLEQVRPAGQKMKNQPRRLKESGLRSPDASSGEAPTYVGAPKASEKLKISHLIIDGNHINSKKLKAMPYKLIVKADEKVFSCAAASIIAKVTRDRIMVKYHKKYPHYRFDIHKGYCTKLHLARLKKFGPSPIHRKSFEPVRWEILNPKH